MTGGPARKPRTDFARILRNGNKSWAHRMPCRQLSGASIKAKNPSLKRNIIDRLSEHSTDRIFKYSGNLRRHSLTDSQN